MRLLIIADTLDNQNAGVHIFTKSLVKELCERNDGNEYILVRQKADTSLPSHIKQVVLKNIALPIGYASFRLFFMIPIIAAKHKVDAVFEPAHFGPFNLPKRILRLTFIHDLTPIIFKEHHRWHSQILQRIFLPRILKSTDYIFTNSKHTSRDLEKYFPSTADKNKAILLGRTEHFVPMLNEEMLKKNNITKPYFLSVGTIEPRKNLTTLLDAFTMFLATSNADMQLVIAGGVGWKSEEFEAKYNAHKHKEKIIRLGYVAEELLPILYSHSMALVYPSLYEGFGFPVLEAMSCGAPVICSSTSSLPEVGGTIAHYIDPKSEDSLVSQLTTVYNYTDSERKVIYRKSLDQAAKFSWQTFTTEFISKIEELLSK